MRLLLHHDTLSAVWLCALINMEQKTGCYRHHRSVDAGVQKGTPKYQGPAVRYDQHDTTNRMVPRRYTVLLEGTATIINI
jgi:hypothetical protein